MLELTGEVKLKYYGLSEVVTWRSKLERGSNTELVFGRLCVSCAGGT